MTEDGPDRPDLSDRGIIMAPQTLPPLDKLDPAHEWQAWQPDERRRWDRKWAGHLYRRAAFGANLDELRTAEKRGLTATLDLLFSGEPDSDDLLPSLLTAGQYTAAADKPEQLRGWWLYCMLHSGHPLREKLTLFWHNHFATSIAKVNSTREMFAQNKLLARTRPGQVRPVPVGHQQGRGHAALARLQQQHQGQAQRKLCPRSHGVVRPRRRPLQREGHPRSRRAFTGWHTDSDGYGFEFNARLHDDGIKTVLGQTGNWNGDDVVRIILQQPACARFLVRKLYRFYVSETHEPSDRFLEPLAESFRQSDYDIAALLRRMLSSRHFFSEYAFRQRIKSPIEFVLGAVRRFTATTATRTRSINR